MLRKDRARKMYKKSKLKIMVVLGGGGHTTQMLKLVELLGEGYNYVYVAAHEDKLSTSKVERDVKLHRIHSPRIYGENWIFTFLRTLRSLAEAVTIVIQILPDVIISCGPGLAIPLIIAGKILGSKVIFIEDWSRIRTRSLSGRIAYFLSDLFFIQWPELKKVYPKGIYAGRLA